MGHGREVWGDRTPIKMHTHMKEVLERSSSTSQEEESSTCSLFSSLHSLQFLRRFLGDDSYSTLFSSPDWCLSVFETLLVF